MFQLTNVQSRLEKLVPVGWTIVGLVVLYVLWLLIARDLAWGPSIGKAPEQLLPWLSGSDPKILAFYSAPVVERGSSAVICYGVLNVKAVRLDPPVQAISPSLNRCVSVEPKQTTAYTLYATGNDGKDLTASFTVQVVPPPPSFIFVDTSGKEIEAGDRYSVCYGVKNAVAVRLQPPVAALPPSPKNCVMFMPPPSANFKITAVGEDGRTTSLDWSMKVIPRKRK
jgi:hypothetical protein